MAGGQLGPQGRDAMSQLAQVRAWQDGHEEAVAQAAEHFVILQVLLDDVRDPLPFPRPHRGARDEPVAQETHRAAH